MPANSRLVHSLKIYGDTYWEIGQRLKVVLDVIDYEKSGRPLWQDPIHSLELGALQLRKVFELIMIGCLVPREYMFEQFLTNVKEEGYADRVYRKLLKVNENFFPVPVSLKSPRAEPKQWSVREGNILTCQEFLEYYTRHLSKYLHEENVPRVCDVEAELADIKMIAQRTFSLISHHRIQLSSEFVAVCVLRSLGAEPEVQLFELVHNSEIR